MALGIKARGERMEMARRFETGFLSKREFCRREQISSTKLNYWLARLDREKSQETIEGEFLELVVSDDAQTNGGTNGCAPQVICELELPHGVNLRFFGPSQ